MEDQIFATCARRFSTDLSEERRETVVVVLTPSLKRMVKTLSTLHPHPEKQLGDIFELLLRLGHSLVPGNRRISDDRPGGSQKFPDDLIVRDVGQQAVANPRVKGEVGRNVAGIVSTIFQ